MVDVIIPTYRARDTLPRALDSLVAQTKKMFIVTIAQDCDGEDYSDIVDEYRRRGLKIRVVVTKENGGPGMARQLGMDTDSMCDYFMFMDSDDMLMPRAVEILYREAKLHDADLIASDFIAERKLQPPTYMDVLEIPSTWCHGKIYKAKFLRDNQIRFRPELRLNEDSYFNLVAVSCAKSKFQITETTYLWMDNKKSLTRSEDSLEFFRKSWEQYVVGQVWGIIKIYDQTHEISAKFLAASLINIFYELNAAKYFGYNVDNAIQTLETLQNYTEIKTKVREKEFWAYVVENLSGCYARCNELIYHEYNFSDWLHQILNEEKV